MLPVIKRKIALILILTVLSVIAPAWGNPSAAAGTGPVPVIFEKDGIIYLRRNKSKGTCERIRTAHLSPILPPQAGTVLAG